MKAFYTIFRLILIANLIASILIVISNEYNDHVNIALSFYAVLLIFINGLLSEIKRDHVKLSKVVRDLN